jgi:hypothetical protein
MFLPQSQKSIKSQGITGTIAKLLRLRAPSGPFLSFNYPQITDYAYPAQRKEM